MVVFTTVDFFKSHIKYLYLLLFERENDENESNDLYLDMRVTY